ncbi:MAG TPA: nitrogenase molybdenum-iron protein alpha chain, partial [Campylobacterales bacterium]|nr:nitrogenase molybdenum-iron protein alpha chain [Campylobacterales bacterium]
MGTETLEELQNKAITEILEVYPAKAAKNRAKHLGVDTPEDVKGACDKTKSNKQTVPGVMSQRGCAYAGSKGVVWGPVKDMIHISHGPIGCGQYSRAGRRNYYIGTTGVDTFVTMNFSTDFTENDIVFGGDKKLKKALGEIDELFPLNNGITIQSECPIGLIGDDIQAVAKWYKKESDTPTIAVSCEGFRGVSQSLGHHLANDSIRDEIMTDTTARKEFETTDYDVAIIGD